jgi:DNA invertase Pin-like site-specific DNA recombinase
MNNAVAYFRVSTKQQGQSGLGLEAQQTAVNNFVNAKGYQLKQVFTEIETGSNNERQQLQAALKFCRLTNSTLIIAKLDRLSRNAAFLLALQESKVKFIAVDNADANEVTIGILAVIAQNERKMISERTRSALQAAKARGVKLGNPNIRDIKHENNIVATAASVAAADQYAEDFKEIFKQDTFKVLSLRKKATYLNYIGFKTRQGKQFNASTVRNIDIRLA